MSLPTLLLDAIARLARLARRAGGRHSARLVRQTRAALRPRLPRVRTLPALASLAAFLMIAWAMWAALDVRRSMPVVREQSVAIQELLGRVDRLDEALTATVQLAASTGDARWERRYEGLEAEILTAIDSLGRVAAALRGSPTPLSTVTDEGAGPGTMADLEHRALALVRDGDPAAAWALLESPAYAAAKEGYARRKAALLDEVRAVVAAAERRTDARLRSVVLAAGGSFLLMIVVWGVIVNAREAREQQRLAAELRQSEQRLRAIVDVAPVAIIRMNPQREVQFWNPAAERIFGWRAGEVLGRPYPLAGPEHRQEAETLFAKGFAGETLDGVEIRRYRKDGTELVLRMWNAVIRNESGEVVGQVGVLVDVTEQRALEQRLLQSQKLEAVGQLAGGIAHDFNNVLTAVRGHAELLLDRMPRDDAARQDLEEIRRSADRATRLTRQLLAFSRQQVLQPRVLDLGQVVTGVTESMLRRLIGEHIRLVLSVEEDLGRIEADPTQIEQVLLNLAVNARDAMPEGGQLDIRLENIQISEQMGRSLPDDVPPGSYVRLVVSDTGAGMDEETRGRAFEPFFTTKRVGQGTGLGLATVFGIVKQSGGYVWVQSRKGRGTEVEIVLPRVEKALPPAAEPSQPAGSDAGRGEIVLLVEDDHAVRSLARRVLERAGYHVLEAADPSDALLSVVPSHGEQIDVLVTDVVMPDMSGNELAERITALYPRIRTIFMSGYTEDELVRRDIVTGPSLFLQKPFGPPDLTRSVRQMLDRTPG